MKRHLILKPQAQLDAEEAAFRYSLERSGLGDRFTGELDQLLQRITEYPRQFPELELGVRRGLLRRFPYSVYFLVEDDKVVVIAVLHQHRHPDPWRGRL